MNVALLTAAGKGTRMQTEIPKQFIHINNKPVILYTLEAFQKHPNIDGIIVVCLGGWDEILKAYAKQFGITKLVSITNGGSNGQESIKNGLDEALKYYNENDMVLIHDAIRPMVSNDIISDNIIKCEKYGNATAISPCSTVVLEKTTDDYSTNVVNRDKIVLTQTPQAFILKDILSAHEEAKRRGIDNSVASCSLFVELGRKVYYSMGNETNIKLTRPGDIEIFKALLTVKKSDWMK